MTVVSELRRLLAESTPGEWCRQGRFLVYAPWSGDPEDTYVGNVADAYNECDAALIVALRNHADALLDVVEAAKTMREAGACPHIRKGTDAGANREWVAWQTKQAELDHALARLDPKETS